MSDGQTLRIPVAHTEAYIIVRVADSDTFQRDGYDVHSDIAISFTQAILGGRIRTPGINGAMDVMVCEINSQNLDLINKWFHWSLYDDAILHHCCPI